MSSYFFANSLCFLVLFSSLLFGEILETNSIRSILEHVEEDTLVIADLDNTLIESETQLGSSQWGDYLGALFTQPGRTFEEVDCLVSEMWCKVQPLIKIRTVDPETPKVIGRLRDANVPFIGLTARRKREIEYTHKQLKAAQITFSHAEGFFELGKGIVFNQGVIYCSPLNKKSLGLGLFLEESGWRPKKIIFIDDKLSHVVDVEQFVKSLGIAYLGIRFSGADARVLSFCPSIANLQWEHFPEILSDEESLFILKSQNLLSNSR